MGKTKLQCLGIHIRAIKLQKEKLKEEITIKIRITVTYNRRKGVLTETGHLEGASRWLTVFYFFLTWVMFTL